MWTGLVIGTVVATRKDEGLVGYKLLIVRPFDPGESGPFARPPVVAIDSVGAGVGEDVLVVSGSSARVVLGGREAPVDAAIIGIIDTIEVDSTMAQPRDTLKLTQGGFGDRAGGEPG